MTIIEKIGNILDSDEQYIVHQTNCVMTGEGGGLAYDLFKAFPYANCYKNRSETKVKDMPGTIDICGTGKVRKTKNGNLKGGKRYIINLMGQYYPGGPRYNNDSAEKRLQFFQQGLDEIGEIEKLTSIAFPYNIGCGLGGGDWKIYKDMISDFAESNPKVKVVIYKLQSEVDKETTEKKIDNKNTKGKKSDKIKEKKKVLIESESEEESDDESEKESDDESECEKEGVGEEDAEESDEEDNFCDWSYDRIVLKDLVTENDWKKVFDDYTSQKLEPIETFITEQIKNLRQGLGVYPPQNQLFNAMNTCPLNKTKVVIIGQDPYHGPGQAMGLSFSVPPGIPIPPSLKNIYKEIANSGATIDPNLGDPTKRITGDLTHWANQGVLLLNATLTVIQGNPNKHNKIWKPFTDYLIKWISDNSEGVIFVLWGNFAQNKKSLIDLQKHTILNATHPSPLSANKGGFFGCNHFVEINNILEEKEGETIKW